MTTAQRKQHEALQRRHSILSAARQVFRAKGYAGTTVAQIAQAADLATGTLYLYFTGKDALYVELLAEGYELLEQRLRAQAAQDADPRTLAGGLIDVFFDFAREYPEYFDIIFFVLQRETAQPYQDNFPPEQIERLDRWRSACQDAALSVFERVDAIAPDARQNLVETIWSMLAGVVFYFGSTDNLDRWPPRPRTWFFVPSSALTSPHDRWTGSAALLLKLLRIDIISFCLSDGSVARIFTF